MTSGVDVRRKKRRGGRRESGVVGICGSEGGLVCLQKWAAQLETSPNIAALLLPVPDQGGSDFWKYSQPASIYVNSCGLRTLTFSSHFYTAPVSRNLTSCRKGSCRIHAPDLQDSNPNQPLIIWGFEGFLRSIFIIECLLGFVLTACSNKSKIIMV